MPRIVMRRSMRVQAVKMVLAGPYDRGSKRTLKRWLEFRQFQRVRYLYQAGNVFTLPGQWAVVLPDDAHVPLQLFFIAVWGQASSPVAVAKRLGWRLERVLTWARRLSARGIHLKSYPYFRLPDRGRRALAKGLDPWPE
jgi:hypothetical protein